MKPPRRWTVIASGLLIAALGLVVLYTNPPAFSSPIAVLVVTAIGFAAVLLQVRLHRDLRGVRSPLLLNVFGIAFAILALFGELIHMTPRMTEIGALGAIGCFAVSGTLLLEAMRKHRPTE